MSVQLKNGIGTFIAGEALAVFRRVKLSAGTVVYADAADDYIGVTQGPADSGSEVAVRFRTDPGTFFITAAGAISANAACYASDDGKVAATGTIVVGVANEAATANNDQIEVIPAPAKFVVVAAGIHSWAGGAGTTDSISVTGLEATDVVVASLAARASTETLVMAANDAGNDQIDLTLSANGTNTTTKIHYAVLRAVL